MRVKRESSRGFPIGGEARGRRDVIGCEGADGVYRPRSAREGEGEVKLKADGCAGTCLAPKSVWSCVPHV